VILQKSQLERVLPLAFEAIRERYEPGRTVAVAGSLAMSARLAHEVLGIPHVTLHLQPVTCLSVADPPVSPEGFDLRRLPAPLVKLAYRLLDSLVLDPLLAPTVNADRARLGLAPVHRVLSHWAPSPQRVIGLFPKWFGPVPDCGPEFRHGGFVLFDDAEQRPTPPALRAFLEAGVPPVVFSFGSAMKHGRRYFEAAVDACRRAGLRGVLLGRSGAQIPEALPAEVHHADYAPFSEVLPRTAALVHHGGIGTCAQAMRAGVPQLVMPLAYDQGDNAARAERLGVAGVVRPRDFTGRTVAAHLGRIVASERMRTATREVSARFRDEDALATTCSQIEEMIGKDAPGRRA
jgi:rhamnosyltransferase subunit B